MQASFISTLLWLAQCALLVRASGFGLVERAAPSATPISVAPAQNWYAFIGY